MQIVVDGVNAVSVLRWVLGSLMVVLIVLQGELPGRPEGANVARWEISHGLRDVWAGNWVAVDGVRISRERIVESKNILAVAVKNV